MYRVWKLGQFVASFATRDSALGYVNGHISDYGDYEITDESDE